MTYKPGQITKEELKINPKNCGDEIVRVGDFIFNVEKVDKASLIAMRKYLPANEYRLLKNRKSARLCRKKRKEEKN